jgi:hypothetical protein
VGRSNSLFHLQEQWIVVTVPEKKDYIRPGTYGTHTHDTVGDIGDVIAAEHETPLRSERKSIVIETLKHTVPALFIDDGLYRRVLSKPPRSIDLMVRDLREKRTVVGL